jgi:hypothetical protein
MVREVQNRTPGWSESLPPRLNLWGEPIILDGALGPDMISPIYTSTAKHSPVDEEIVENDIRISMPPRHMFGTKPSDDIPMGDESVKTGVALTPEEYSFFVRVAAGHTVEVDGEEYSVSNKLLKEELEELVESAEYKNASGGPDGAKALMIRTVILSNREAAKAMLMQAFPELAELMEEKIESRAKALAGDQTGVLEIR